MVFESPHVAKNICLCMSTTLPDPALATRLLQGRHKGDTWIRIPEKSGKMQFGDYLGFITLRLLRQSECDRSELANSVNTVSRIATNYILSEGPLQCPISDSSVEHMGPLRRCTEACARTVDLKDGGRMEVKI